MGTPRRGFNNFSPYSQGMGQYPSQGPDYRSQHVGGMQEPQQQNFGFYEDKQSFAQAKPSTPHFYQNKAPQEQMHRPRQQQQQQQPYGQGRGRNFSRGGGGFNRRPNQHFKDQVPQYYHPSMMEDPWRELMDRHNAIHAPSVDDEQVGVECT